MIDVRIFKGDCDWESILTVNEDEVCHLYWRPSMRQAMDDTYDTFIEIATEEYARSSDE